MHSRGKGVAENFSARTKRSAMCFQKHFHGMDLGQKWANSEISKQHFSSAKNAHFQAHYGIQKFFGERLITFATLHKNLVLKRF